MNVNKGSIETVLVKVTDELAGIVELPVGTVFDIYDREGVATTLINVAANVVGMQAQCRVDTTTLDIGDYDLYLKFSTGGEAPILGPHPIRVV